MSIQVLVGKLLLGAVLAAGKCGPPEETWTHVVEPIPSDFTADAGGSADIEAQQMFVVRCAPCHGTGGHGDGIAAAALTPHPRNFHDLVWQASITDGQIERTIREGGEALGKSPLMPANPDLVQRPDVVAALRRQLRDFAAEPSRVNAQNEGAMR